MSYFIDTEGPVNAVANPHTVRIREVESTLYGVQTPVVLSVASSAICNGKKVADGTCCQYMQSRRL